MPWDIFCSVIDNHGDAGVCWRLAVQLADRGVDVRLWIDDAAPLAWMAPQGHPRVEVVPWRPGEEDAQPGEVVIEAFGCTLSPRFQSAIAQRRPAPAWINLEYLTAESFAERAHGLPSPVLAGPAAGLTKHFFYPGFTQRTGGLLREPSLSEEQEALDRAAWLQANGIVARAGARLASLFCYEPPALPALLRQLAAADVPTQLLVTAGRATAATRQAMETLRNADAGWNARGALSIAWLPLLTQREFDRLLWACDLNFVRGEDSLVRALWAGKPFVWHIYPQDDDAHHAKLDAFLDWLEAPAALRDFHRAWNGVASAELPALDESAWAACARNARARLVVQDDLVTRLQRFVVNVPR